MCCCVKYFNKPEFTTLGDMVSLPRIDMIYERSGLLFSLENSTSEHSKYAFVLCNAINKAQGQTFERMDMLLLDSILGMAIWTILYTCVILKNLEFSKPVCGIAAQKDFI